MWNWLARSTLLVTAGTDLIQQWLTSTFRRWSAYVSDERYSAANVRAKDRR